MRYDHDDRCPTCGNRLDYTDGVLCNTCAGNVRKRLHNKGW